MCLIANVLLREQERIDERIYWTYADFLFPVIAQGLNYV